jgi:hypothetical protein
MTPILTLPAMPALLGELERLAQAGREWRLRYSTEAGAGAFQVSCATMQLLLDVGRDDDAFLAIAKARAQLAARITAIDGFAEELAGNLSLFRETQHFADRAAAEALKLSSSVDRLFKLRKAHQARLHAWQCAEGKLFAWVGEVVAALDEVAGEPVCGKWQLALVLLALAASSAAWEEFSVALTPA